MDDAAPEGKPSTVGVGAFGIPAETAALKFPRNLAMRTYAANGKGCFDVKYYLFSNQVSRLVSQTRFNSYVLHCNPALDQPPWQLDAGTVDSGEASSVPSPKQPFTWRDIHLLSDL